MKLHQNALSCISIFNESTIVTSGHDNKIKVVHLKPKIESPLFKNKDNDSAIFDSIDNDTNDNNNGIIDDSEEYLIPFDNITLLPADSITTTAAATAITTSLSAEEKEEREGEDDDSNLESNNNNDNINKNNSNYRKALYNCNLVSILEITIPEAISSTVTPQEICKNYCKLKYPNICEIYGYTTDNDIYYLVYNGEISTLNNFIIYCQNNVIQWKYCECVHSILCLLNSYDYIANHSNYIDRILFLLFISFILLF